MKDNSYKTRESHVLFYYITTNAIQNQQQITKKIGRTSLACTIPNQFALPLTTTTKNQNIPEKKSNQNTVVYHIDSIWINFTYLNTIVVKLYHHLNIILITQYMHVVVILFKYELHVPYDLQFKYLCPFYVEFKSQYIACSS